MSKRSESLAPAVHAGLMEKERMQRLRRAQRSAWFLGTEILDRHWLDEAYHKPMMDDMDERNRLRRAGKYAQSEFEAWSRDYRKTTVREIQMVQDYLWDPACTSALFHAVDEHAISAVDEVGRFFMDCEELRKLDPAIMPPKALKRFVTSAGFKLKANKSRFKSGVGIGQSSESTGIHAKHVYLDDIIGQKTVDDSSMPSVRSWMGMSLVNILGEQYSRPLPGGRWETSGVLRSTGTRWDPNDIYADWLKSPEWDCRVRACYEKDGVPDIDGEPMLLTRDQIEFKRQKMSSYEFSCQMMNQPLPASERSWQPEYERDISLKEINNLHKAVFVLSDPAPMHVGGLTGDGERQRADGSKDDWAIAVVAWCVDKQRRFAVLLDGDYSPSWTTSEGMDRCCRFMTRWNTPNCGIECYGGLGVDYKDKMLEATKRNGNRHLSWIDFKNSYAKNAKKLRFEDLYDLAKRGDFYVADTCDSRFKNKFYDQNRATRWLPNGRNASPYDDVADAVSRCTDRAVLNVAPMEQATAPNRWDDDVVYDHRRSRYLGI